jgi:hypothetical protein
MAGPCYGRKLKGEGMITDKKSIKNCITNCIHTINFKPKGGTGK